METPNSKKLSSTIVKEYIKDEPPTQEDLDYLAANRPKTRGDCRDGIRPCPFIGCRHHLYMEISRSGSITLNFKEVYPEGMTNSCSLDVAEKTDGNTLEEIGEVMNLTRERIRQVEEAGLRALYEEFSLDEDYDEWVIKFTEAMKELKSVESNEC